MIGRSSILSNCLNILIWIFQGFSLFSYQRSFVSPCLTATRLSYQILSCLSTTFFILFFTALFFSLAANIWYITISFIVCQQLFLLLFAVKLLALSANFCSISNSFWNVKHFLTSLKFNLIGNLQLNAFPNQPRYNIMIIRQSQPFF